MSSCVVSTKSIVLAAADGVLSADLQISATAGNKATLNADGLMVAGDFIETGDYVESARATKAGFLLCDGSAVSRSTYAALFAVIGVVYGAGDSSTTFNLPDRRDRVGVGAGSNTALAANEGVSAANRHGTRHRHTPHTHPITPTGAQAVGTGGGGQSFGGGSNATGTIVLGSVDGGSGVATDSLDGSAFLGVNIFIKT